MKIFLDAQISVYAHPADMKLLTGLAVPARRRFVQGAENIWLEKDLHISVINIIIINESSNYK